jgi:hypothetical protein
VRFAAEPGVHRNNGIKAADRDKIIPIPRTGQGYAATSVGLKKVNLHCTQVVRPDTHFQYFSKKTCISKPHCRPHVTQWQYGHRKAVQPDTRSPESFLGGPQSSALTHANHTSQGERQSALHCRSSSHPTHCHLAEKTHPPPPPDKTLKFHTN